LNCFDKAFLTISWGVHCTAADGVDAYLNGAQLAARLHSALRCRSVRFAIITVLLSF